MCCNLWVYMYPIFCYSAIHWKAVMCHHWIGLMFSLLYLWFKQKWYPSRHCLETSLLFMRDTCIPVIPTDWVTSVFLWFGHCCQHVPLLSTDGEAVPGALGPVLGSPVQERWAYCTESSEVPWRSRRGWNISLWGKAERAGTPPPGQEKVWGESHQCQ